MFLRDLGTTEIGLFAISAAADLLLVEDVRLVRQTCSVVTVHLDDGAVARCSGETYREIRRRGFQPPPADADTDVVAGERGRCRDRRRRRLGCIGSPAARTVSLNRGMRLYHQPGCFIVSGSSHSLFVKERITGARQKLNRA
jgi:hypothetical protein